MRILKELCAVPTAPFAEGRVMEYVERFARARRSLHVSRDRAGNRLVELRGRSGGPRLVFVAHADHPGFVARAMRDGRTLEADFRGGVLAAYVRGAKVRFFDGERVVRGRVTHTEQAKGSQVPRRATLRVNSTIAPGTPGMFDLTEGRVSGGRFHARACDDLAGLAAILTMLDALHRGRSRPRGTVAVLVTRAEEVGFVGAIAAAKDRRLLRGTDRLISVECSSVQPFAPQGNGVIVRVGDRTTVFDSGLTWFLTDRAQDLAKRDKAFKFQRALMPGGSCEGTVFDAWSYTTGAVCLPLGNYHNMDRARKKLAPENIHLGDWESMVKLFVEIAREAHTFRTGSAPLRARLEKRFAEHALLLYPK
jgi:endoglucanase